MWKITSEDNHDEPYVINILTEEVKLNLKYGTPFEDHSKIQKTANIKPKQKMEHPKNKLRNATASRIRKDSPRKNAARTKLNKARETPPGSPILARQVQLFRRN